LTRPKNLPDLFQPIKDFRLGKKSYKIFYLSAFLTPYHKVNIDLAFALWPFFDPNNAGADFGNRKQFQKHIAGPATFPPRPLSVYGHLFLEEGRGEKDLKNIWMRFAQDHSNLEKVRSAKMIILRVFE
jgi:hypothetical protein